MHGVSDNRRAGPVRHPPVAWRTWPPVPAPQLRGLLRASTHGKLRVLFPDDQRPDRPQWALAQLDLARHELRGENIPFDEKLEVGAMIEIPPALVINSLVKRQFFLGGHQRPDSIHPGHRPQRRRRQLSLYDPKSRRCYI